MTARAGVVYDPPAMRTWVLLVLTGAALGASSPPVARALVGMCESYRPSARHGRPPDTGSEHVGLRCVKGGPRMAVAAK